MSANQNPSRKELRDFGLILGGIVAVMFGAILPWLRHHPARLWPWIIGVALISAALIRPETLRVVHRAWTAFGFVLGWINSRIIMAAIFYAVVAPMGLVMRLFRDDPMAREFDPSAESYRLPSVKRPMNHMEKPF